MLTRALLTVVATASTILAGGAAPAIAAETIVPAPFTPTGVSDSLDVANNWCVAPLRLAPFAENIGAGHYYVCNHDHNGGTGGVNILNNLCIAPIDIDPGTLDDYAACNFEQTDGPHTVGPVNALRNFSVLGAQLTP